MKKIITRDVIIGAAVMILAAAVFLMANKFAVTDQGVPMNPALYPQVIAVIIFIMGGGLLISTLIIELKKKPADEKSKDPNSKVHYKSVFLALGVAGYVITLYLFGFIASTLLFTSIASTAMGTKWHRALLISVPLTIVLYIVFFMVFKVPHIQGVLIGWK